MAVCYDDILSIDKIIEVYRNIRSNTCHKEKLVRFELAFSCNVVKVFDTLNERKYFHHRYNLFLISKPKYRIIMSEIMYDKIVNHLVSKYILLPVLTPKLIEMNVATRKDKGTKAGIYYTKKYINTLKQNHDKVYALKCDISKYFYNINHEILLEKLNKDIDDPEILSLISNIVHSTDEEYINIHIDRMINKEINRLKEIKAPDLENKIKQLKSLPHYIKGKGLPIGNETSQILAIYYLNHLDHYVKEQLKIKHYVRYMDDFILFHHDKEYLKECLEKIKIELDKVKLTLNKKTQIYDLDKGMNFLGYKFKLNDKRLITLINNQTKKRVKRKLKRLKKQNAPNYELVKASYNGYFIKANSKGFLYKAKF